MSTNESETYIIYLYVDIKSKEITTVRLLDRHSSCSWSLYQPMKARLVKHLHVYREVNDYLEFYLSEKIDLNVSDVNYMVLIRFTVTGGIGCIKK